MRLAWVLLCLTSLGAWASTTTPEQFGAYGNGIRGTSGVANGTTTFTDPNASWTASDVNKTIFIVPPIQTSYPTYQGTIAAVGSSTSITIHPALGWSSGLPGCSAAISGITRAASMVVTISTTSRTNPFAGLPYATLGGLTGTTQVNGKTYAITATGGAAGAWTITFGGVDSTGFSRYAAGGTLSSPCVSYYYGNVDNTAFAKAQAAVAVNAASTGYATGYNNYSRVDCLTLTSPKIYLLTQAVQIQGSGSGTAPCWKSDGGQATVAINISGSNEVVTFGSGVTPSRSASNFGRIDGITFDCTFSGADCLSFVGFQNPLLQNVHIMNAQNDCLEINPSSEQFIQQASLRGVNLQNCGNNAVTVAVGSGASGGSFANELDAENLVMGAVSSRTPGGACFYFKTTGAGVDSWAIANWKCTENWAGNTAFQPSAHCIVVGATASGDGVNHPFPNIGASFTKGYCEQAASYPLGPASNPIYIDPSTTANLTFQGFGSYFWGSNCSSCGGGSTPVANLIGNYPPSFNGAGYLTVAKGTPLDIYKTLAGYSGMCEIYMTDGTHANYVTFTVTGIGGTAPSISPALSSGKLPASNDSNNGADPNYALSASSNAGVAHLTLTNNGTPNITAAYQCQTLQSGQTPTFTWN